MLENYGGINVRHGTDFYQFDGGKTIQPELINMARFVLSWFGGDCCTGEYDTCAETDDRSDVFHHNPRFRGGDLNGDITVTGRHAASADLNICIDGAVNGQIQINPTDCTNPVAHSCTNCP